jgi:hypothetical protein
MFEIDDVPDFADPGTTTASLPVRFWGTGGPPSSPEKLKTAECEPKGAVEVIDDSRAWPQQDAGAPPIRRAPERVP